MFVIVNPDIMILSRVPVIDGCLNKRDVNMFIPNPYLTSEAVYKPTETNDFPFPVIVSSEIHPFPS